jgi:CRISPR-associated endonuclease Csn1
VRNRGRLVYLRDKNGNYLKDAEGNNIVKWEKGDSIRGGLFKETFVAKLRDVVKDKDGKPIRNEDKTWRFKEGDEEFFYAVRVPVEEAKKYITDIIDPVIRELVEKQKNKPIVLDYNNKPIRHVRIKANKGKIVKPRLNFRSTNDYKNSYYAASDSLPYAALLQKVVTEKIERKLIPISTAEIAQHIKKNGKFELNKFIEDNYKEYSGYQDKKLLKVGQKAIILENDDEFAKKDIKDFQTKRLYVINQFDYLGRKIIFNYHLESRQRGEIDKSTKESKNAILRQVEKDFGIPEIVPDDTISILSERKKDFEKRLYDFKSRLIEIDKYDKSKALQLKKQIEEYQTESSKCNDLNPVPILGRSVSGLNFLLEGEDFEVTFSGELKWKT